MQLISLLSDESQWDDPCWEKWKEIERDRGRIQGMMTKNRGRRKGREGDKEENTLLILQFYGKNKLEERLEEWKGKNKEKGNCTVFSKQCTTFRPRLLVVFG